MHCRLSYLTRTGWEGLRCFRRVLLLACAFGLVAARAGAQTTVTISPAMPPAAPRMHGPWIIGVFPGTPVVHTIAATGQTPITFSATGLPAGVSLDTATGRLGGSVASAGRYDVAITASNAVGMDQRTLTVVVGDTLALTPPLGWNSYDSFDDSVTQAETLAQAAFLRDNLLAYGWQYVVVDFRWYDPNAPQSDQNGTNPNLVTDSNGRFLPAPNRFPDGFAKLAEDIHAMGLKFGIHIMRGIPRKSYSANTPIAGSSHTAQEASDTAKICRWNSDNYGVNGNTAAGQAWYDSIFQLYASWGVDFVKVDDITSNPGSTSYWADEVEAIHRAIQKSNRSIVLSLSPGETPVNQANHLVVNANMWRMSDDFWDRPADLAHIFDLANAWQVVTGPPGHWPDADMLPLGHLGPRCPVDGANRNTRFTRNEQVTMLSLWALLPSPLMLGANLTQTNDSFMRDLLMNEEVLSVSQDALGARAKRVVSASSRQVWVKDLSGNRKAVGLFNRAANDQQVLASAAQLGVSGKQRVRDLWRRADSAATEQGLDVLVPGQAGLLYVLTPDTTVGADAGDAGDGSETGGATDARGANDAHDANGSDGTNHATAGAGGATSRDGAAESGTGTGGRAGMSGAGGGGAGTSGAGGTGVDSGRSDASGDASATGGAGGVPPGGVGGASGSVGVGGGAAPNPSDCACSLGARRSSFVSWLGAILALIAMQRRQRKAARWMRSASSITPPRS
jgi:alpha-galactosidase